MTHDQIITATQDFVRTTLAGAEGGHDWWHLYRVWKLAKHIAQTEQVNMLVVELGALLHDIADHKFHNGDEEIGPCMAREFLESLQVDPEVVTQVIAIMQHISFKGGGEQSYRSPELDVVQDADRLEALGAIGIARAFSYGGHKGRELYNPQKPARLNMTKEEYMANTGSTINHFYEKLLLLKDRMNTQTGRLMAAHRHAVMEQFLEEFYAEWDGVR